MIHMEISIKKPCHENWDRMTPNEQGAFCNKCVKTVIDFSNKSIEEIKTFFDAQQKDKICGRFEKKQLSALSFDAFFNEFKSFSFTKRVAVILYFTFGMCLFNIPSGLAQTNPHVKGDVEVKNPIMGGVRVVKPIKDSTKIAHNPKNYSATIKGKIKVKPDLKISCEEIKMGEVIAVPETKPTTVTQTITPHKPKK